MVTERSTSPTLVKSGNYGVPGDVRARTSPEEERQASTLLHDAVIELVEEGRKGIEELYGIDQPEQDAVESLAQVSELEEPIELEGVVGRGQESKAFSTEPGVLEDKPEQESQEDQEDQAG